MCNHGEVIYQFDRQTCLYKKTDPQNLFRVEDLRDSRGFVVMRIFLRRRTADGGLNDRGGDNGSGVGDLGRLSFCGGVEGPWTSE